MRTALGATTTYAASVLNPRPPLRLVGANTFEREPYEPAPTRAPAQPTTSSGKPAAPAAKAAGCAATLAKILAPTGGPADRVQAHRLKPRIDELFASLTKYQDAMKEANAVTNGPADKVQFANRKAVINRQATQIKALRATIAQLRSGAA